jgi:hypothetical protein
MAQNPSLTVIDLPSTASKSPANLGPAGVAFWQSIMAEYDISDAGGRALLEQAAFAYDRPSGCGSKSTVMARLSAGVPACVSIQVCGVSWRPDPSSAGRCNG